MDQVAMFQRLYGAFNRRDADGALAMMSEDVDWPNAWKGCRLVGREAVRDYWIAQWTEIDPGVVTTLAGGQRTRNVSETYCQRANANFPVYGVPFTQDR